jgi:hypothetical protein
MIGLRRLVILGVLLLAGAAAPEAHALMRLTTGFSADPFADQRQCDHPRRLDFACRLGGSRDRADQSEFGRKSRPRNSQLGSSPRT